MRSGSILLLVLWPGIATASEAKDAAASPLKPGLTHVRYNSSNFTRPAETGIDRQLDHDTGATHSDYAQIWLGALRFPVSGRVTLIVDADNGARLRLDSRLVIDSSGPKPSNTATVQTTLDQVVPCTVELIQQGGTAHLRLYWSWEGQPRQLVPGSAFWHEDRHLALAAALHQNRIPVTEAIAAVHAGAPRQGSFVEFARDILPLFQARCYQCHGPETQKAGLRLDVRSRAMSGGDSGPAIVPPDGIHSLLVQRIVSSDDGDRMPPEGARLSQQQIALLQRWIDEGAVWPDALAGQIQGVTHWSFQKRTCPPIPSVRQPAWVRNPVDAFVLERLDREGIAPSPEAGRRTLMRRLSLDLLGLAPEPGDVQAFVDDRGADAYERLVDRLLESPHFGERWGRHWLDLARYADSHGYENDGPRPEAHRYRDWVVEACNRDLPFDAFTIEQLAGDLLPDAGLPQKIAAGFHRNSIQHNSSEMVAEEYRIKAVKDRVETTGTAWLGLTVGCCQCHSHKFDPITQTEYYGLFAIFNNADDHDEAGVRTLGAFLRPTQLHIRGDFTQLGPEVRPHTPAFLPPMQSRGGMPDRLDLARWIVDPAHPLTSRVAVNRFWQHLFGQGLVTTPEDYGLKGEAPAHPELLDWLASEFIVRGWSRKQMLRLIACSASYRQSSVARDDLLDKDPANRLWARQNRFRVEAEIVHDLALQASGLLSLKLGGPAIQPPLPAGVAKLPIKNERLMEPTAGSDQYRRGLYINVQRTFSHPLLSTFDAADGNQTCPCRDRTNTPIQALALLNDPVFRTCAQGLARRLVERPPTDEAARIQHAFELCLSRPPSADELQVLGTLLTIQRRQYGESDAAARGVCGNGAWPIPLADAAAWVSLASTLINLDEFYARE